MEKTNENTPRSTAWTVLGCVLYSLLCNLFQYFLLSLSFSFRQNSILAVVVGGFSCGAYCLLWSKFRRLIKNRIAFFIACAVSAAILPVAILIFGYLHATGLVKAGL